MTQRFVGGRFASREALLATPQPPFRTATLVHQPTPGTTSEYYDITQPDATLRKALAEGKAFWTWGQTPMGAAAERTGGGPVFAVGQEVSARPPEIAKIPTFETVADWKAAGSPETASIGGGGEPTKRDRYFETTQDWKLAGSPVGTKNIGVFIGTAPEDVEYERPTKAQVETAIKRQEAEQFVSQQEAQRQRLTLAQLQKTHIELPGGDHGTVINDGMPDIFRFFAAHPKAGVE